LFICYELQESIGGLVFSTDQLAVLEELSNVEQMKSMTDLLAALQRAQYVRDARTFVCNDAESGQDVCKYARLMGSESAV
jgi:hypothetical protein